MSDTDEQNAEINVDYDTFVDQISNRNREDSERAQSSGVSRAEIKEFLENTGLHPKAFSFMRMIMKQKKFATQMDILRSIDEGLPLIRAWIDGNHGQRDMLDGGAVEMSDEQVPLNDDSEVQPFDPEAA